MLALAAAVDRLQLLDEALKEALKEAFHLMFMELVVWVSLTSRSDHRLFSPLLVGFWVLYSCIDAVTPDTV